MRTEKHPRISSKTLSPSSAPFSASSRLFLVRSRLCDCASSSRSVAPATRSVCSATRNAAHVEASVRSRSAATRLDAFAERGASGAPRAPCAGDNAEAWLAFVAEERGSANEADVASSRGPIEPRLCRRRGGGEVSGMRRVSCGAARLLWGRRVGLLVSTFPIRSFSISKQYVLFVVCDGSTWGLTKK